MSLINFLFSQSKQYVTILITFIGSLLLWLFNREQKLKDENVALNNNLKEMDTIDEQLLETQRKENEIASGPLPDCVDVDSWLSRDSDKQS